MGATVRVRIIIGQSNDKGNAGNSPVTSPPVASSSLCLQWWNGTLGPLNDALISAGGSQCPAYANTLVRATGQPVCIVMCAVGSTPMQAAANSGNGSWSTSGTLLQNALNTTAAAISALQAANYTILGQPDFIGMPGEGDADAIDSQIPGCSEQNYKTEWSGMEQAIQAAYPGARHIIPRIALGYPNDTPGWQQIRQAQEDYCSAYKNLWNLRMGFRGAAMLVSGKVQDAFTAYGLRQPNTLHYTQDGYNLRGHYLALCDLMDGIFSDRILFEPMYPNDSARISWQTD